MFSKRLENRIVKIKTTNYGRQNNHPKEILPYSPKFGKQKLDYIHNNPINAGLVEKAEDYIYSSARDYAGIKGLIEIEFLY
jgi:putative transposase